MLKMFIKRHNESEDRKKKDKENAQGLTNNDLLIYSCVSLPLEIILIININVDL